MIGIQVVQRQTGAVALEKPAIMLGASNIVARNGTYCIRIYRIVVTYPVTDIHMRYVTVTDACMQCYVAVFVAGYVGNVVCKPTATITGTLGVTR